MGRVRKYKKFKACDPFSKRGGNSEGDSVHDEPPELFDQRVKNSKKRKQYDWDDENEREILLQQEARRHLKLTAMNETKKEVAKIEGKRDDESLRDFKKRVREGTKKTLSEEIQKMTSTAKRSKEWLKERKLKKKARKNGDSYQEETIDFNEFSQASNGRLRPSDLGTSSSSFARREVVAFGERAERPPDLKQFTSKLNARKEKSQLKNSRANGGSLQNGSIEDDSDHNNSDDDDEDEDIDAQDTKKTKKKKSGHIMDRDDMEGNDGLESVLVSKGREGIFHAGSHRSSSTSTQGVGGVGNSKKMPSTASTKNVNFAEMEKIRNRVQDAYKLLRDKRRAASTNLHKDR